MESPFFDQALEEARGRCLDQPREVEYLTLHDADDVAAFDVRTRGANFAFQFDNETGHWMATVYTGPTRSSVALQMHAAPQPEIEVDKDFRFFVYAQTSNGFDYEHKAEITANGVRSITLYPWNGGHEFDPEDRLEKRDWLDCNDCDEEDDEED